MRNVCINVGGDEEIRTPGGFTHTRFPSVRTRPLCDVSFYYTTKYITKRVKKKAGPSGVLNPDDRPGTVARTGHNLFGIRGSADLTNAAEDLVNTVPLPSKRYATTQIKIVKMFYPSKFHPLVEFHQVYHQSNHTDQVDLW